MGRLPRAAVVAGFALFAACSSGPLETLVGAQLYARGSRALEQGDSARAIADLERAAAQTPHASEIHNHLGAAYAAEGRHAEALAAFERAVALDCDNAAAQQNLSAARARDAATPGPTR